MHIKKSLVVVAVTFTLLATNEQIVAQNGYGNFIRNRPQVEDPAAIDSRPGFSSQLNPRFVPPSNPSQEDQRDMYGSQERTVPAGMPPITSSGSIMNNELRGSSDGGTSVSVLEGRTNSYDAQPLPPRPLTTSGSPTSSIQSSSNFDYGRQDESRFSSQPSRNSMPPIERLDPSRLVEGTPLQRSDFNQQGRRVLQADETVSALAPLNQTPRIPIVSSSDSQVVPAGFSSQSSATQQSNATQQQGFNGQPAQDVRNRNQQLGQQGQGFGGGQQRLQNPNGQRQQGQQRQPANQQRLNQQPQRQQVGQQQRTQQQGQNSTNSTNSDAAQKLLSRYDVSSSSQALPGVPVELEPLLRSTPLRYRLAMVQQYWETYYDWTTLQNRRMHAGWLGKLSAPRSQSEKSLLATAKSMAQNELTAAEIQLARSQSKLQQLSGTNHGELLPLPMDQPLVTKYNSHYDWYASRNRIPAKLKGINEMLPRTHELIVSRSRTVQQAEAARRQATEAFKSGQLGLSNVLESGRVWHSAVQGFSSTVFSYNQAISDYALTITPAEKPVSQLVSMLVAKPKTANAVARQNSVINRQAGQSPQYRQSQNIGSQAITNQNNNLSFNSQQPQPFNPQRNNTGLATQRLAQQNPPQQNGTPFRNQTSNSPGSPAAGQGTTGNSSSRFNQGNDGNNSGSRFNGGNQSQNSTSNRFRTPPGPANDAPDRSQGNLQFQRPGQFGQGNSTGSSQNQNSGNQFGGGSFGG